MIVLENEHVKYLISADGSNTSFIDKRTGRDYCERVLSHPLMIVEKEGERQGPTACSWNDGKWRASNSSRQTSPASPF